VAEVNTVSIFGRIEYDLGHTTWILEEDKKGGGGVWWVVGGTI
jgi:hypothetical protein